MGSMGAGGNIFDHNRIALFLLVCRFALGMLLWCLSSGRTHALADEAGRLPAMGVLVARVLSGKRPDLAALREEVPPGLRANIERCWACDPAVRPTASAMTQQHGCRCAGRDM